MEPASAAPRPRYSAQGVRWNLKDLYASPAHPRLREDQSRALARARDFARRYRGHIAALDAQGLASALAELEGILALAQRPALYAHLLFAAESEPPAHAALLADCQEQTSRVQRELIFWRLEWLALPDLEAQALLESPLLARHRHFLQQTRAQRAHVLSEAEEAILSIKAQSGRLAWQRLFDQVVASLRCPLREGEGGEELSLEQALALLHDPSRERRAAAAQGISQALASQEVVLAGLMNAVLQDHAEEDHLRRRPHPMHARNLENQVSEETVEGLLAACEEAQPLVARYHALKTRLLGLERLQDHDRYAPLGTPLPPCDLGEARRLVRAAYGDLSPQAARLVGRLLDGGWIDAEPRTGKAGGAFCAATLPELHPYILLHYADGLRDVMTLAHELGHGLHQLLAARQGFLQMEAPLTLAETASVFGELLALRRLLAEQPEPTVRLGLLCGKVEDAIVTVFRQAALTRFEQALHKARREQGVLSAQAIGELWLAANGRLYGASLELSPGYARWWGYISHFIHTPFYCYAYCYGQLLALSLFRRYQQQGAEFVPGYLDLLRAGGSAPPHLLLQAVGVRVENPSFWQQGLAMVEDWIAQAEAIAHTLGLEGLDSPEGRAHG